MCPEEGLKLGPKGVRENFETTFHVRRNILSGDFYPSDCSEVEWLTLQLHSMAQSRPLSL